MSLITGEPMPQGTHEQTGYACVHVQGRGRIWSEQEQS